MIDTMTELMEYLDTRGAKYGISGAELFDAIPSEAQQPKVAYEFMQLKDISHKVPLSQGGNPAGDNWILEDSSVNRARGDSNMTTTDQSAAELDNLVDGRKLAQVAMVGGSMAAGSAIVDGTIAAATAATTAAEATFITTVVVPTVLTTAAIGGSAWLLWKGYKILSGRS